MRGPAAGLWLLLQALRSCGALGARAPARAAGRCQPVEIPLCRGVGYNSTRMPNLLGHASQREAAARLQELAPLVEHGCHAQLRLVLCSLFAPMCAEQVSAPIPACRALCEQARRRCAPALERLRPGWPPALDCGRLPSKHDPNFLCMEAPGAEDAGRGQASAPARAPLAPPAPAPARAPCANPGKFHRVGRGGSCAPRCARGVDVYWSRADKRFAAAWLAVWAALCFASSAFTVLTFLLDPGRFRYPERPIVFLALCHCVYSVGYIIRLLAGAESIACDRDRGLPYVIQEGLESAGCTLVFLVLYYFGMAGSLWWVVLTLSWFLAAGRKWGHEAIEARSGYFHLAAWAVPAVKAILVLVLRRVAGDELTGLCYVGSMDAGALTAFVLVPLACYLALGSAFLLSGFVALFRIRRVMRTGGENTDKLERLMVRIGAFSLLHTVPAACVLGCYVYERRNAARWKLLATQHLCRAGGRAQGPDCLLAASIPAVEIFLVKVFMLLVVGTASGMWVWTSKTLQSWQQVCQRGLGRQGRGKPPGASAASAVYRKALRPPKPQPGKAEGPTRLPTSV